MNLSVILGFLKALLPKKRIGSWILGILGAGLAVFMGVNNAELKEQYCSNPPVELPKLEAAPSPAPSVAPEKK